mmetsp:Transcript_22910/g.29871  ORF Transcript_22910/g.29871 Transcript_22910/m.29871 type:complete len:148 (+) Transcript_22910:3-446(+)
MISQTPSSHKMLRNVFIRMVLFWCLGFILLSHSHAKRVDVPCNMCEKVINDISKVNLSRLKGVAKPLRESFIIEAIESFCAQQDHLETSERKMCYYLEPLMQTTARALLVNMPIKRICKKLGKENPDICSLETVVENRKDTILRTSL